MKERRLEHWLTGAILLGMGLGVALGWAARQLEFFEALLNSISWIGVLFKQLLLLIIAPLVLTSIFTGVVGLGDIRKTGRRAGLAVLYFTCTTGISVVIGLILVNVIRPGEGFDLGNGDVVAPAVANMTLGEFFVSMLKNAVKNPFASMAGGDVLGIIVFALLLGAVTSTMGKAGEPLVAFFEALNSALFKLTDWVMWVAPLGVFALVAEVVANQGLDSLLRLGNYAATVVLGLGLHGVIVLPLVAWIVGRVPPWRLIPALRKPIAVAFSTASSAATLPVTMEVVENELQVDETTSRFVCPLGATLNMDGTALYEAVAAMFIAQAYGIELGLGAQVLVFLTATVAAVGAAGIPGAGLVTMSIVLVAVGLPIEAVGIILAVDRVLDMCRTAVNVAGDSVGAVVVDRFSKASGKRTS